ncbi:rha-1 [Symbiodinium natans]|uniref:Rha-1 protein n=1 Tax=Symbiodinium natans TaxID=878477 RepID=A0A812PTH0_9DINO|nr:rha-1 [Symbiodinium natans]
MLRDLSDLSGLVGHEDDESLLILDCEGGNNAMAAIRTLVNVFGLLLGSQVVFVANGMATEQALQTLGMSLAARSLLRLESCKLPEQELVFVVNKNTLRYEGSALEKILEQKFQPDDPGRQELRDTVRECFPHRSFFTVPLMGMPAFDESLRALRSHLVSHRKPLEMGGIFVNGRHLAGVMELVVAEVQKSQQVNVPSMNRYVIYEGFLVPLTQDLSDLAQSQLPELSDYDPALEERNPIEATLRRFDEACSHLSTATSVEALKVEARQLLSSKLWDVWRWLEAKNEVLGNEIRDSVQETREVEISSAKSLVGGAGLLSEVVVTKQLFREEGRTVLYRKKGGHPECLPWKSLGTTVTRTKEFAFDSLPALPKLRGSLLKTSPNTLRAMLRLLRVDQQPRLCVLQDGHFMWFEDASKAAQAGDQAKGCINFLVHRAQIRQHSDTAFVIFPAEPHGWREPSSFTGDSQRSFSFDACDVHTCTQWIEAVAEHIRFGNLAAEQLGAALGWHVKVQKPMWSQLQPDGLNDSQV